MFRGPATVVLALVVAACGGSPAASSPTGSPAPSPLAAGTHTSTAFQPAVTYTVPGGWENPTDSAAYMLLRPLGDEVNGIHVFHNPAALSQATDCPAAAEPNVGASSLELIAWIRGRKGLVVGTPALATVAGLPATSIDVGIADGWTASCSFANGLPTVPLFFGRESGLRWIVAGGERMRLYFVDVPGRGVVVVDLDSFDGTGLDGLLSGASPIMKSLSFASG